MGTRVNIFVLVPIKFKTTTINKKKQITIYEKESFFSSAAFTTFLFTTVVLFFMFCYQINLIDFILNAKLPFITTFN